MSSWDEDFTAGTLAAVSKALSSQSDGDLPRFASDLEVGSVRSSLRLEDSLGASTPLQTNNYTEVDAAAPVPLLQVMVAALSALQSSIGQLREEIQGQRLAQEELKEALSHLRGQVGQGPPMGPVIHGTNPTPESGDVDQLVRASAFFPGGGLRAMEEAIAQQLLAQSAASYSSGQLPSVPSSGRRGEVEQGLSPRLPEARPELLAPAPDSGAPRNPPAAPEVSPSVIGARSGGARPPHSESARASALTDQSRSSVCESVRASALRVQDPSNGNSGFAGVSPQPAASEPAAAALHRRDLSILSAPHGRGGSRGRVAWAPEPQVFPAAQPEGGGKEMQSRFGSSARLIANRTATPSSLRSPRGNLDLVRRQMAEEICRDLLRLPGVSESSEELPPVKEQLLRTAASALAWGNHVTLRVAGALPWRAGRLSKGYQAAVLLFHALLLCGLVVLHQVNFSEQSYPFLAGDLVLASGCVCALFAIHIPPGNLSIEEGLKQLEDSNQYALFTRRVDAAIAGDTLATLVVWLAFLGDRLGSVAAVSGRGLALSWAEALRHTAVILSSWQLATLVLLILRVIRNMCGLVDAFCTSIARDEDYVQAVAVWNVLQAQLRMTSETVEGCFAVLQSVLVLLALAMAWDIQALYGAVWALTASGLLIVAVSQILLRAAAVTDACVRVAQLVNSSSVNGRIMDAERKYLVDFIVASEAGFYVFNVRLGAGYGIKVIHHTGLITIALARLVLPFGFHL